MEGHGTAWPQRYYQGRVGLSAPDRWYAALQPAGLQQGREAGAEGSDPAAGPPGTPTAWRHGWR
eukprot:2943473-Alexandrium_andersonii.AAC.1